MVSEAGTVRLAGRTVAYRVVVRPRARRMRVRVDDDGSIELLVPSGWQVRDVPSLLTPTVPWIFRQLERVRWEQAAWSELRSGQVVPYRGRDLPVYAARGTGHRRAVTVGDGRITVVCGPDEADAGRLLRRWLVQEARAALRLESERQSALLGVRYARITVRDQATRWGSCSTRGTLSFNWRLILAPDEVLRYVVTHETAHLRVPNHSDRFWALVARHCPQYREQRSWLRVHGRRLSVVLTEPDGAVSVR